MNIDEIKERLANTRRTWLIADYAKSIDDIEPLIEAVEARDKVIEDMDFQSGCSWCEKNNEIRNKHESE